MHLANARPIMLVRFIIALVFSLYISAVFSNDAYSQATLRLNDGDIFQGDFYDRDIQRDSASNEFLVWKCNAFLEPMLVPWSVVDSISHNLTNNQTREITDSQLYVVELEDGESVSGRIEQLDDRTIQLTSSRYAPTQLNLDRVRSILKVNQSSFEGVGRLSVNEWKQVLPVKRNDVPDTWLSKAGSIETVIAGSSIAQTATLPSLAVIDVDVAWTHSNPNWTVTVGNNLPKLELRVRKLEQRDDLSITLLIEEESVADIVTIMIPSLGLESLRLKILCDLEEGRFVLQQNGRAIGEIASQAKSKSPQSKFDNRVRFQVTNDAPGGMILRELKVSRSPFSMPRSVGKENTTESTLGQGPKTRLSKVLLTTGKAHIGSIAADETRNGNLRLNTIDGETLSIAITEIERIEYAMTAPQDSADSDSNSAGVPSSTQEYCVIQTRAGERFAGKTLTQSKDQLTLVCNAVTTPIGFPANDVSSLQFVRNANTAEADSDREILMKLVCDEVHSNGKLVPSQNVNSDTSGDGWAWRPTGLSDAFLINPSINGTIDIIRNGRESGTAEGQNRGLSLRTDAYGRSLDPGEPALYLASGDSLPGKLVRLENNTLTFSSELFGQSSLDTTQVKGIRQLVYTGTDRIDALLLKRLLTVPRMARQSPPAHLVVSRDGDMIRGNVTFIDEDLLRIEVRDEEREIWMKNVAEIVWLDPAPINATSDATSDKSGEPITDDLSADPASLKTPTVETNGEQANCQLVLNKGSVVSLIPSRIEGGTLLGVHPQLGECNIPLEHTVQILFGNEMEKSRSSSRFAKWKLRHAIDPKFVTEEADAASGEASELVGKPAVDFELRGLDGKMIKLSDMRGRVVVLDFWASWCGPCRKSLPVIQRIADDFGNESFSFYAINVDEEPNVVQGSAIVLGISNNCLLDPKGTISKAYGASAIPYTVVIDKEGIVRRVFVGANDEAFNTLRESISQYLQDNSQ